MRPISSVAGKDVYKAYCENCHGEDLKGHGPDAAGLRVPPADLTTIALRHGGTFSSGAVQDEILGWHKMPRTMRDFADKKKTEDTGEVTAASYVMPAFGPIFGALYPQDRREREIRISNLVSYIKKMQVKSVSQQPQP
jgi:mono/diheme cytochrome c family protein